MFGFVLCFVCGWVILLGRSVIVIRCLEAGCLLGWCCGLYFVGVWMLYGFVLLGLCVVVVMMGCLLGCVVWCGVGVDCVLLMVGGVRFGGGGCFGLGWFVCVVLGFGVVLLLVLCVYCLGAGCLVGCMCLLKPYGFYGCCVVFRSVVYCLVY